MLWLEYEDDGPSGTPEEQMINRALQNATRARDYPMLFEREIDIEDHIEQIDEALVQLRDVEARLGGDAPVSIAYAIAELEELRARLRRPRRAQPPLEPPPAGDEDSLGDDPEPPPQPPLEPPPQPPPAGDDDAFGEAGGLGEEEVADPNVRGDDPLEPEDRAAPCIVGRASERGPRAAELHYFLVLTPSRSSPKRARLLG